MMLRHGLILAALAALVCLLVGCHLARPPTSSPARLAGNAPGPPAAEVASKRGRLVLEVRWPERDVREFKAALIPRSTNALAVTVSGAAGISIARQIIGRGPGGGAAAAEFELDPASNLSVSVKA